MEATGIITKRFKKASIDAAAAGNDGERRDSGAGAALTTRVDRITRLLSSNPSMSTVTGATSTAGAGGITTDGDTESARGAADRLLSAQDSGTLNSKDLRDLACSGNSDDSITGLPLSLSLVKGLRRKSSSIGVDSSSSGGGSGSGNNSDNSGLVSLGNNSFGFNFDSEEGMMGSGNGSPPDADKSSSSDSDNGTEKRRGRRRTTAGSDVVTASSSNAGTAVTGGAVATVQVSRTPSDRDHHDHNAIPGKVSTKSGSKSHGKKRNRMMDGSPSSPGSISKKCKQGSQPLPPESKPSSSSLDSQRSGASNQSSEDGSAGSGNDSGTSGSSSGGGSSGSGSNGNGSRSSSGKSTVSSLTMSSSNPNESSNGDNSPGSGQEGDHAEEAYNIAAAPTAEEAAEAAVAHLQSIANAVGKKAAKDSKNKKKAAQDTTSSKNKKSSRGQKRKAADDDEDEDDDGDSGGYNTDDEGGMATSRAPRLGQSSAVADQAAAASASPPASGAAAKVTKAATKPPKKKGKASATNAASMPPPAAMPVSSSSAVASMGATSTQVSSSVAAGSAPPKKKAKMTSAERREERNQREKERSFRISKQIDELRSLLSSGGVIVPKGTKSAVLSEAASYIRMLQQHQYKSEIDRAQLIQQMQIIGGGALGPQAATAVRHVAAQNGVWSLGNFGGVPPRSAMQLYQQGQPSQAGSTATSVAGQPQEASGEPQLVTSVDEHDYRFVFNSCSVGMAIASMGGAFIDCNQLFCQLSQYSKQEVCSMTIFNLTSRQDLQHAFDLISKMISPPPDGGDSDGNPPPCVLRGSMKHRNDLGLSISLVKGEDGIAKCFCVTLIKNPASPFDPSRPIPATADFLRVGGSESEQEQLATSSQQIDTEQKRPPPTSNSGNMSTPAYTTG